MGGLKMKKLIDSKGLVFLFVAGSVVLLLTSCVVYKEQPSSFTPVTVRDIVKMTNDKVPPGNIINEIRSSRTAYNLKASEYAKLQQSGVADTVLNYMQKTQLDLVRRKQASQDSYSYYAPGYWYGGYGYGWPYSYWGWNVAPTIVLRGGGRFHGSSFHGGGFHGTMHRGR